MILMQISAVLVMLAVLYIALAAIFDISYSKWEVLVPISGVLAFICFIIGLGSV